jgi:glyceraldehyde 3-phosphate dehydrogenase
MSLRIAINGFGRIGRSVARIASGDPDIDLVAVNDLADPEQLAYLFKHDTVHGKFDGEVSLEGNTLTIAGDEVQVLSEKSPADLPWDEMQVDTVIESTGLFRHADDASQHLDAGAGRVLISAPGKGDIDYSVVYGVNHDGLEGDMAIVDVASCTTNCLAPIAKVLHEDFGIVNGSMTTVHAYTNSQNLLDGPHKKDPRRGRTAAQNMVPTTTGAATAVTEVIPELEGKLDGMAVRVPTPNVSLVDLSVRLENDVTVDEINAAMREHANGDLEGVLGYTEEPVVSTDMMDNPHSSIFDAESTMVTGGDFVKVISWYDNEWGFSNRMLDVAKHLESLG